MTRLPAAAGYGVLAVLRKHAQHGLNEAISDLGADEDVLEPLLRRLKKASNYSINLGYCYSLLLSWLVARIGPQLNTDCELVEAAVDKEAATATGVVMPRWTLSTPIAGALQRRVPCVPLVDLNDETIAAAYAGLVRHLELLAALPPEHQRLELLNSAIPWRIVGLVDRLEPETGDHDKIKTRIGKLRSRTLGVPPSSIERDWWKLLNPDLCAKRHILSHLGEDDGWTFKQCVDDAWTLEDARRATAAIGLAVLKRAAIDLQQMPANSSMLDNVLGDSDTAWIDDQEDS